MPPATTKDRYGTVRIAQGLLREADAFVTASSEGYMNRSQVATDALRAFLATKRLEREHREAWDAWVRGGRKGQPPKPGPA